jgi:hypothetical protein
MKVRLGVSRRKYDITYQHAADSIELDIEPGEMLVSVWVDVDGLSVLRLPLDMVPRGEMPNNREYDDGAYGPIETLPSGHTTTCTCPDSAKYPDDYPDPGHEDSGEVHPFHD